MVPNVEIKVLAGPVTVAYRKAGKRWYCTALEFDLLGIGDSRDKAFAELRSVVNTYLFDVLRAKGPVRFFNPSDAREWTCKNKKRFSVVAIMARPKPEKPLPPVVEDVDHLRPYRNRIKGFDLLPVGA